MTKEEKWWNRFNKVMQDMPYSMEILVDAYGKIFPAKRGSTNEFFIENGHIDNVPILDFDPINKSGVENIGSSL